MMFRKPPMGFMEGAGMGGAQMPNPAAPVAPMGSPAMAGVEPGGLDLASMLAGLSEEELMQMFQPFEQQSDLLGQQRAQAQDFMRPQAGRHSTAAGAIGAGLGDVIRGVGGGIASASAMDAQKGVLDAMQKDAAGRVSYVNALRKKGGAGGTTSSLPPVAMIKGWTPNGMG